MIRSKQENMGPIVIDLTGPDGNAFVLIGMAKRLGRQLGMSQEDITGLQTRMMSGDYENLLNEFDKAFGEFVILER